MDDSELQVQYNSKQLVAGDVVEGAVLMNIPLLETKHYEEVHTIFAGIIKAYVLVI